MDNKTIEGVASRLQEDFLLLFKAIRNVWNQIKELLIDTILIEELKPEWDVPLSITRSHQVILRKPVMIRARTTC